MASPTYSARVADERLNAAIDAYATEHKIGHGAALVRLALEGLQAKEGKPINRFAVMDPKALDLYLLTLGELKQTAHVLNKCRSALKRARPFTEDDRIEWERDKLKATSAFDNVQTTIKKLEKYGHLELLLWLDPKPIEQLHTWAVKNNHAMAAFLGALLGKPAAKPSEAPKSAEST
ncbi:MAG: hypothetical protein QM691_05860 [Opitutaceae bacterium]